VASSDSDIIARTITGCVLFACLGDDDRESLKNAAKRRVYKEGEVLIEEGDEGDDLFIIDAGDVEVSTRLPGGEVKLATLGSGGRTGRGCLNDGCSEDVNSVGAKPGRCDHASRGHCAAAERFASRTQKTTAEDDTRPGESHPIAHSDCAALKR